MEGAGLAQDACTGLLIYYLDMNHGVVTSEFLINAFVS